MIRIIVEADEPLKLETIARFDVVQPNMRRLVGIYLCAAHGEQLFSPWKADMAKQSNHIVFPCGYYRRILALELDKVVWFYDPRFTHTMLAYA